jgi:uncharacterized protein
MKVWLDITNTPQVHFLLAILKGLKAQGFSDFLITTRDFSETKDFLKLKSDLPFRILGKHEGKSRSKKAIGLINRFLDINKVIKDYDISLSCGSESAIWSSYLKKRKSIAFGDNDLARQWTYGYFVTNALFPKSIPKELLNRQGLNKNKLYQYDGFKEDVYIADFVPDKNFLTSIPFQTYVVVRPENIQANYLERDSSNTITPDLLKMLSGNGINILYLPRYKEDRNYAAGIKNIFIPDSPVNGLDACYYSNGVFTGAGTLAREAACLGVPSFSFFLGKELLAVDKDLVKQNKMYYSRDPNELIEKYIKSDRMVPDMNKSKAVNQEVINKTSELIRKYI